jgi:hypothetical protein
VSYAVAYLRLHRTQPVDLTSGFSFGFRAVTAAASDQPGDLVRVFDLDILRARRLAKIVAGYSLERDLQALSGLASSEAGRGIRGMEAGITAGDARRQGMARVVDIAVGHGSLETDIAAVLADARIDFSSVRWAFVPQGEIDSMAAAASAEESAAPEVKQSAGSSAPDGIRPAEWLAACATERALVCAATVGRMLDRLSWDEPLDISAAMAANAWDCFASLDVGRSQAGAGRLAVASETGGAS